MLNKAKVWLTSANEEFKIAIIDNLGERTYHIIEKKCDKILNMKNLMYCQN